MNQPREKDQKKVHVWGVIGYNFKSPLYRYDCGNSNGKMTQQVYLTLLEREVASWPVDAVLEEDGDSGHGPSKSNLVRTWKTQRSLKCYFNYAHSPDLAPIENAWQAPKTNLRQTAHWDDDMVWEVAKEGWEALSIRTINLWCDSMPERLQKVLDSHGQLTAY